MKEIPTARGHSFSTTTVLQTLVTGVNHTDYGEEANHIVLSDAPCTTNRLAPPGLVSGTMLAGRGGSMTRYSTFTRMEAVVRMAVALSGKVPR